MIEIHQTASVSPRARLGQDISIQENCVIRAGVTIGSGTVIRPGCIIGTSPEKYGFFNAAGLGIVIGENCVISDGAKIHSGTERMTRIGDRVHILAGAHIGHDAVLEDDVTVSVMSVIGGHAYVMRGANVGMNSTILQRQVVGAYTMIGAGSNLSKKSILWPGNTFAGSPVRLLKQNTVGLQRAGIPMSTLMQERMRFEEICRAQGIKT